VKPRPASRQRATIRCLYPYTPVDDYVQGIHTAKGDGPFTAVELAAICATLNAIAIEPEPVAKAREALLLAARKGLNRATLHHAALYRDAIAKAEGRSK
jgi:hypothetical protein